LGLALELHLFGGREVFMEGQSSVNGVSELKSWRQPPSAEITIYELLKTDHQEILDFCEKIRDHDDPRSAEVADLFSDLKKLLTAHTKAEEMVFYNALHDLSIEFQDDDLRFDVVESFEEHHLMEQLLRELSFLDSGSLPWMGKVKVLHETLERHITREEQDLFHEAQQGAESLGGRSLAEEFLEEKEAWMADWH